MNSASSSSSSSKPLPFQHSEVPPGSATSADHTMHTHGVRFHHQRLKRERKQSSYWQLASGVMQQVVSAEHTAAKQAFYNTAANFFLILTIWALFLLYFVFEQFVRPLLWAVMVGVFLHPLKQGAIRHTRKWLSHLRDTDTPLLFGCIVLPFKVLTITEELVKQRWGRFFLFAAVLFCLFALDTVQQVAIFVFFSLRTALYALVRIVEIAVDSFFLNYTVIKSCFYPLAVLYFLAVFLCWRYHAPRVLRAVNVVVWCLGLTALVPFLVEYLGMWPFLVCATGVLVVALMGIARDDESPHPPESGSSEDDTSIPAPLDDERVKDEITSTEICMLLFVSCLAVTFWEWVPWLLFWGSVFSILKWLVKSHIDHIKKEVLFFLVVQFLRKGDRKVVINPADIRLRGKHDELPRQEEQAANIDEGGSSEEEEEEEEEEKQGEEPNEKARGALQRNRRVLRSLSAPLFHPSPQPSAPGTIATKSFDTTPEQSVSSSSSSNTVVPKALDSTQLFPTRRTWGKIYGETEEEKEEKPAEAQKEEVEMLLNTFVPSPIHRAMGCFMLGDKRIVAWLDKQMNGIMSVVILLLLVTLLLSLPAFFVVKFSSEAALVHSYASEMWHSTGKQRVTQQLKDLQSEEVTDAVLQFLQQWPYQARKWAERKLKQSTGYDIPLAALQDTFNQFWADYQTDLHGATQLYSNSSQKLAESLVLSETKEQADATPDTLLYLAGKWWQASIEQLRLRQSDQLQKSVQQAHPDSFDIAALFTHSRFVDFFKANASILSSAWDYLKINSMLLLSWLFNTLWSTSQRVFNFLFSVILFFTALFYLLVASDDRGSYIPFKWFLFIFPEDGGTRVMVQEAISQAINEVFLSLVKTSVFHVLWTWLTLTILGVRIVYISTFLAFLFAIFPVIGPYWVSLPGCLELWLIGKPVHAVVLFCLHLAASWFIDPKIYSEIKMGHYYVTGLAVVGGLYFLGLEGVIVGPTVLCVLLFLYKILNKLLNQ